MTNPVRHPRLDTREVARTALRSTAYEGLWAAVVSKLSSAVANVPRVSRRHITREFRRQAA